MNFTIGNKEALHSAIEYSDHDVVYLIGSPLSCSYNDSKGVPSVSGMLEIITNSLSSKPRVLELYNTMLSSYNADIDKYQQSFSFLAQHTSPNTVNGIIRKATLNAFNGDTLNVDINNLPALKEIQDNLNQWSIPPATEALANILLTSDKVAKTVLTPNFDPLLSIALSKLGHSPTRTVLHGDSNIEQFHSPSFNIIHFHGYWLDADTLHTPAQLTFDRPHLKQSLIRILNNKTLVVLGYGGWDDVFTQVLFSLIGDSGADFDIIWAFYESNEQTIINKYINLINAVKPAIQRGRFRIYGGINCHEFLPEFSDRLSINKPSIATPNQTIINDKKDQAHNKDDEFESEYIELTPWKFFPERAHNYVRATERSYLINLLNEGRIITISTEWGISHNEFVHSITTDSDSPYKDTPIYKIDLYGISNRDQLLEKIEESMRVRLPVFIQNLPKQDHILYFDNFGAGFEKNSDIKEFITEFETILSIAFDFNKYSKAIVVSKRSLSESLPSMSIFKFEDYDAKFFILNHSALTEELDNSSIDTLIDIAQGIPSKLEQCIKDLHLLTTDELYEVHYTPESHSYSGREHFPKEIVNRVEMLSSSQEPHTKKSYQLLETLSILELGDSFTNLRKTNPQFNYRPTNIEELYNLELLETTKLTRDFVGIANKKSEDKLLRLPSAVRSYVYSKLSLSTVYEIAKNIANVHLGPDWRIGNIQLCSLTIRQMKENDKVAGSTQVLLAQLLKCAIDLKIDRDINASFQACRVYCKKISTAGRYKEVISFTKQIKAIAKESEKIESLAYFNLLEGCALRMLSDYGMAEELLLHALNEHSYLSKHETVIAHINLMFLYKRTNNESKAINSAKLAIEIEPKNSDALLTLEELSEIDNIHKLEQLEKKFRNSKREGTANNACFKLCEMESSHKRKVYWLNRVLNSGENEFYNKFRAVTYKAGLSKDTEYTPTSDELKLLRACYVFSFSQRVTSLFNKSNKILWEYYSRNKNIAMLFILYRHSSLYWRVYQDNKKEKEYSGFINELMENLAPESIDTSSYENAYIIHRAQQVMN